MEDRTSRFSLQQWSVTDILTWYRRKELELNPAFQRRAVWTPDARSYLIDTILLGYSIPKIYLRTKIDTRTQRAIRDVVDGQQRLKAIIDFADNKLTLNRRSRKFEGNQYIDLDPAMQEAFLGYEISVDHLKNATDNDVLEVFARLNTYTVKLNPAELRNASYDTDLKWFVVWTAEDIRGFLSKRGILSITKRVRMEDDVFVAEILNLLINCIVDGGAAALDRLYRSHQQALSEASEYKSKISEAISWMDETVGDLISGTVLGRTHQVLMLFAAYVFQQHGLPLGKLGEVVAVPERRGVASRAKVIERLSALAEAIETEDLDGPYRQFVAASLGATTRYKSRSYRFAAFNEAIMCE